MYSATLNNDVYKLTDTTTDEQKRQQLIKKSPKALLNILVHKYIAIMNSTMANK